ncbi:MAG TPA: hypothetical protein VFE27_24365 [Acidobacteriaceae bacterium]|nr:hypothetical protein [Acidobacteriaceae bacterium]
MELKIRTTRTLKVTEVRVSPETQELLAQLHMDSRYQALLDVMEQACIELETAHLNTSPGEPEAVLGGHCMAKASWLFFTYVQKQVFNAYSTRTGTEEEPPEKPSLDDVLQGIG